MKKYVCKRNEVCAGVLLIRWDNVNNDDRTSEELLSDRFIAFKYKKGRVILFNNSLGNAHDLVYNTPSQYPIVDLNLDKEINHKYIINKYVKLDEFLKYLGYKEELTQYDLNTILNLLIKNKRWLKRNEHLFGNVVGDSEEYFSRDLYDKLENMTKMTIKPHKEEPNYKLIKKR